MENLSEEYIKPFYRCFDLLKNSNLMFIEHPPGFRRSLSYFCAIPSLVLYYLSLTVFMVDLFSQKEVNFEELVFVVPIYVVITQDLRMSCAHLFPALLKAAIVYLNKKEIRSIIVELGKIWRTKDLSDGQIKEKNMLLKSLNFCYKAFYWMNMIGSWQYILAAVLETVFSRYIFQQESEFLLPFACFIPFSVEDWSRYLVVCLFEIYSSFVWNFLLLFTKSGRTKVVYLSDMNDPARQLFRIIYFYLGTEFIMITLSSHLSTEFALLRYDLVHLKPVVKEYGAYSDGNMNDLIIFIERHRMLIALTKKLDDIFNKMVFVNLTSATITICFFGFSAKVAHGFFDMLKNTGAVAALILPIFNLCYYAEMLKESSSRIGDSAYNSLWYKGNVSYQKTMMFIIIRSQKPCYLTILKLMPITLRTFTTVMSNTWSYFSLISSLFDN